MSRSSVTHIECLNFSVQSRPSHVVNILVYEVKKKYACYSGFFCGYLRQIPLSPVGDFKKTPRARRWALGPNGPRAHRRALGVFLKSPLGFRGSGRRSSRTNPNNLYELCYDFPSDQNFCIIFSKEILLKRECLLKECLVYR